MLLIGTRGDQWLGLMLTSKDHDLDAADEARHGRHWMDVGAGGWDRSSRPSEVRLDRLLVLAPDAIRREGSALSQDIFDRVVAAAREYHTLHLGEGGRDLSHRAAGGVPGGGVDVAARPDLDDGEPAPLAHDPQAGGVRGASRAVGQAVVPGGARAGSRPPPAGRPPCAGSPAATRSRRARRGAPARRARPTWDPRTGPRSGGPRRPSRGGRRRPGVRRAPRRDRPATSSGRHRSGRVVSGSVLATDQASPSPRAGIRAAVNRCAREPSGRAAGTIVGAILWPGLCGRW